MERRGEFVPVDEDKARVYDSERERSLPVLQKEPGQHDLEPLRPQPVISPGIYEAEFMSKGSDIVFHFWPYGYHEADDHDKVPPRFGKNFQPTLTKIMNEGLFPCKVYVSEDKDMGSWFVRAFGLAERPFHRELCVKACEDLHTALGGTKD